MVGGMLCCVSPFIVSSIVPGRYVAHSPSKDTRTAATKQALAEVAPLLRLMVDRGIDEQPEAGHLGSVDALGRLLEDALARMSLLDADPKRLDERDLAERSEAKLLNDAGTEVTLHARLLAGVEVPALAAGGAFLRPKKIRRSVLPPPDQAIDLAQLRSSLDEAGVKVPLEWYARKRASFDLQERMNGIAFSALTVVGAVGCAALLVSSLTKAAS